MKHTFNPNILSKEDKKIGIVIIFCNSKMGKKRLVYKKQEISFFVTKLLSILDNPANSDIISWTSDGKSFFIADEVGLTHSLLPEHFKHNNMASFIRQLNLYGFHKQENTNYYTHPKFDRSQPDIFKLIKRIPKRGRVLISRPMQIDQQGKTTKNKLIQSKLKEQNEVLKAQNEHLRQAKRENISVLRKIKGSLRKAQIQGKEIQKSRIGKIKGKNQYEEKSRLNSNQEPVGISAGQGRTQFFYD